MIAAARGGAVAEVEEKLLPHIAKSGDGIGISPFPVFISSLFYIAHLQRALFHDADAEACMMRVLPDA